MYYSITDKKKHHKNPNSQQVMNIYKYKNSINNKIMQIKLNNYTKYTGYKSNIVICLVRSFIEEKTQLFQVQFFFLYMKDNACLFSTISKF